MKLLSVAAACLLSSAVLAADWTDDVYVGASVGTYDVDTGNIVVVGDAFRADDTLLRLTAGYRINAVVALDLQYLRLLDTSGGLAGVEVGFEAKGFEIGTTLSVPVLSRLALFTRLGWNHSTFEITALGVTGSDDKNQFVWGLGAEYDITSKHSLRFELSQIDFAQGEGSGDIRLMSLGYTYRFGH